MSTAISRRGRVGWGKCNQDPNASNPHPNPNPNLSTTHQLILVRLLRLSNMMIFTDKGNANWKRWASGGLESSALDSEETAQQTTFKTKEDTSEREELAFSKEVAFILQFRRFRTLI